MSSKSTPFTTGTSPVIVTREVAATKAKIWSALTDPVEMRQWYFDCIKDFQAVVGFSTEFVVAFEDKTFTHQWEVTEVAVEEKLVYDWQFTEYPGRSASTFEIVEAPDGTDRCSVSVTCVVKEDFPLDIPEFSVESCTGGWDYFMDRLLNYLT